MISEDNANNSHFAAELADGESLNSRRNVDLSFFVWNVNEIDIIEQSFKVKFNLYASWDEDVSNMILPDNDTVHWSKDHFKWDPQIRIMNCKETDLCEVSYSVFKLQTNRGSNPMIRGEFIKPSQLSHHKSVRCCFQQKMQGTFYESFELKNFPFDLQHLHIGITSKWDHQAVALAFDKTKPTRVSSQALQSQTWNLSSPRLLSYNSDWDLDSLPLLSQSIDSATGARYSRAYLAITVSRRPNWVLWNVMTIMTLVGFFTFATYALDPSELGDRQSCVLTLVLTTVAFKYVTMNMMPEISYVTMMDVVIYACMFLQGGMLLSVCIAANIYDAILFDRISFVIFGLLWITILLWFTFRSFSMSKRRASYISTCDQKFRRYDGNGGGDGNDTGKLYYDKALPLPSAWSFS